VDTGLAIDGARLGAQAILTMSNDSWFTDHPLGAAMHQASAAFRSIETRLPQFRVTTNGYSAVIDATGTVLAGARMGERTLVIGDVPVGTPPRTLMVTWGDWVGLVGIAFLLLLAVTAAFPLLRTHGAEELPEAAVSMTFPASVAVLPPVARLAAGFLRAFARGGLLWMGAAILLRDSLRGNTLAQIRTFAGLFLIPEAASWCILFAFATRASIENGALTLTRGAKRLELAVRDIVAVEPWHVPIPGPGASLRLVSGERWYYGLALANPTALARALISSGAPTQERTPSRETTYAKARLAIRRGRIDQPFVKFFLFPIALALPAFRLHQHIAYGSGFGEYYTFGLMAYLTSFAIWWAAWAIGVVLIAAALRAAIEAGTLLAVLLRPGQAIDIRRWLERFGLAALYLGLPAWLLLHVFGG
jgi:apolipoprotein N-acyltransferase